jgi:hypothetical protein
MLKFLVFRVDYPLLWPRFFWKKGVDPITEETIWLVRCNVIHNLQEALDNLISMRLLSCFTISNKYWQPMVSHPRMHFSMIQLSPTLISPEETANVIFNQHKQSFAAMAK